MKFNNIYINEDYILLLNYIIKYVKFLVLLIITIKFICLFELNKDTIYLKNYNINNESEDYLFSSYIENITNISNIYLKIINIKYSFSKENQIIEVKYYIKLYDKNKNAINPFDLSLLYNLHLLCEIYIFKNNEKIYSIANIYGNYYFFCKEYINITENVNFGIKIYKICEINDEIESYEHFYFTYDFNNSNLNPIFQNNNKFNINDLNNKYNKFLTKINRYKKKEKILKKPFKLKSSFVKPPLCYFKRDIAQEEGRWYFNNIYANYFCFCKGESCIDIKIFNNYNSQSCKYFFYKTIIDNNRNLYEKSHYLLSDFFSENIEPSDALPIFNEMIKEKMDAHYLTMSTEIYNNFCLNNYNCYNELQMIYGVKKINGDTLEKYIELILKLKVVITAEKYECIDNIFYNIEYITYIFLGHGVQYIKSYLYKDYLNHKKFDKILLPPYDKIISNAINSGWKIENIIKLGLPKWDNYIIFNPTILLSGNIKEERAIFLMFTWRQLKKGKNISDLYFKNLYNILTNDDINEQLEKNNIKFYYCYHHRLKEKRIIRVNKNIIRINQNDISSILKNSSLIITDFSAIMFDAIIQKKPLILYIPDALDENLKDIYINDYYQTITKLKNGMIYLFEIIFDLKKVIKKIIYYIRNDFILEENKLKFYNHFRFKNKGNTRKFIRYIRMLK